MSKAITLCLVGRPNVGKSSIFNRIHGRKRALVHNEPGVTRDRLVGGGEIIRGGRKLNLRVIDTGGLGGPKFEAPIREQVQLAVEEADIIAMVLDVREGVHLEDWDVVKEIRKSAQKKNKNQILIALINKCDHPKLDDEETGAFYELGVSPIFPISAEHDRGFEELYTWMFQNFKTEEVPQVDEEAQAQDIAPPVKIPQIAIVGKPNVGKSTLLNALLGEERVIVSDIPGTTVDSVDAEVTLRGKRYVFLDTAGIRRKDRTEQGVEVLSVVQTKKALERADVAILMIDGGTGSSDQDEKLSSLVLDAGCSVILAVNKWDMQEKNQDFPREEAAEWIRGMMPHLDFAPILFMSAKNKKGLDAIPDLVDEIMEQKQRPMPTHELTELIRNQVEIQNTKNSKFYYCSQVSRNPPTIVCQVNDPRGVHFSLKRHLVNAVREVYGFMGSPVRLLLRKRSSKT